MTTETPTTPEAPAKVPVAPVASPELQTPAEKPVTEGQKPAESAEVPQPEDDAGTPEKPKVPFKERFSQVYAQKKQAEAEAAFARREAMQLREELDKMRSTPMDQVPYEQQDELRVRTAVKEERLAEKAAEAQRAQWQADQARIAAFQAKVSEARERMPDFDQVFSQVPVSEVAADLIAESEKAAEIAYYLGKNPQDAARIYRLPPHLQGAEIARIEARVAAAPTVRKVSKAPAPPPQLGGASSPGLKDPAAMSMDEYAAWRQNRSKAG